MNKEQDLQLIDQYLTGALTPEEEELFKKRMSDPDFEKRASLMKELAEGIKVKAIGDLKKSLQEEERSIKKKKGLPWKWFIPAAVILPLIVAVWWFMTAPETSDQIFAQHFTPQVNTLENFERNEPNTSLAIEVFGNYDSKNYAEALAGFDQLLLQDNKPNYRFFKANTLLSLGRAEEAITILEELLSENETRYIDETKWYLALAYIKMNDFSSAKPLLEELMTISFYKEDASQILQGPQFE